MNNNVTLYKCKCGKEFTNSQAFNGHKGLCKIHLGEEEFNRRIELRKQKGWISQESKDKRLKESQLRKEQELQQWISEKHKCEKCGKVMTEKYASGRFCCKECARGSSNYKGVYDKILEQNNTYQHVCEFCGKRYKSKVALNAHIGQSHKIESVNKHLNKKVITRIDNVELDITYGQLEEYRKTHTCCEICGKTIDELQNNSKYFKQFSVDHNHVTNEFRGLLCMTCNSALGWFEKNEDAILKYLNDRGKQNKNP